jgi:hypothetical protein
LQQLHGNAHVDRTLSARRCGTIQRQPGGMLGPGSRGPAVAQLQQQLNSAGASVTADGVFGPKTGQAVRAFQQSAGLAADGIAGPLTLQKLQSGAAATATVSAVPSQAQALLTAKIGQVRAAFQQLKAKGPGAVAPIEAIAGGVGAGIDAVAGAGKQAASIIGKPIPTCGLKIPDGNSIEAAGAAISGMIQRDWLEDAADWAGDMASDVSSGVGAAAEAVGDAAGSAADAVGDAAEWVGDAAGSAAEAVGDAAEWVGDTASDAAGAAGKFLEETAEAAGQVISETADQAVSQIEDIVQSADKLVSEGIDAVVGTASELAKEVGELGEDLRKEFGEQFDKALEVAKAIGKNLLPEDIGGLLKQLDDVLKGLNPKHARTGFWSSLFGEDKPPGKAHGLLENEGTVTRGGVKVPSGTGYAEPTFTFADVQWWRSDSDVMIQAKLKTDCHWEIASEGRGININGPNDPAITEISYRTALHDLAMLKNPTKTGSGVTTTFWSELLVARHEQFHCHDYIQKATTYLPQVAAWMEQQTITHDPDGDADIKKQVDKIVAEARQRVEDDNLAYLRAGGEARAYGEGEGAYQSLIDGIKARAKAEKWKGAKEL